MKKKTVPVIIGAGQYVHHPKDPSEAKSPLDLVLKAISKAEEDAGIPSLGEKVDSLCLVNILSLPHVQQDPAGALASVLGARPGYKAYTWVGASAPQWFVNRTAERIFAGKSRLALICGGEAFYSRKMMVKGRLTDPTVAFPPRRPEMEGDLRDPLTALELKYGLIQPIHIYPLFENALRAHDGLSIEEQRRELGEFCSGFSAIAEKNPYAWFEKRKTHEEIAGASPDNRMISFPYTKYMCSIMEVDQAAALFVTDAVTAALLGVPEEKWVYLLGSGDASDIWNVSQRVNFYSSPSVKVAAEKALEHAGESLENISFLDFYSCFPVAPRITRHMLGIFKNDPRPLTVTGGMPYFGGPGNNYSMHAICRMVELLRKEPEKKGLVQALSWFISKHSVGIYSGTPGRSTWHPLSPQSYQEELDRIKGPPLVDEASGRATVETYTLFHDRQGLPVDATVIGRLEGGARFLAKPVKDPSLLTAMMEQEFIGREGKARHRDGFNLLEF